jgi:O-antigen ligase
MEDGVKRYIVPSVVAFAPVLLVLLSWAPSGDWTPSKLFVRNWTAPVVGSELFVILVAVREGMLRSLPRWNWSRPAVAAVLILSAIAVATAWFAPLGERAAYMTAYWFIHGLFGLSILYLCGRLFQPAELVCAYLAGFAAFALLLVIYIFQIPDWSRFNWKNTFMAFSHIRHAGYYAAAIAGLGFGLMAIAGRKSEWGFAFACSSAAIIIALWTGSRGAVLAVAGALVIGLLLAPAFRSLRGAGGAVASLVIGAAVASQLPAPHPMMGFSRMVGATTSGNVTTGRTDLWEIAMRAVGERPLLGYGEGQMSKVATFHDMVQPHNVVLQVTLAWGLAGLACLLVIAIAYCRRALPVVRKEGEAVLPAFMAMAALLILSLYDGSLFYPLPQSIFAACAAIIASRWSNAGISQPEATSMAPAI